MPIDNSQTPYSFGMNKRVFAKLGKEARGNLEAIVPLQTMIQKVEAIELAWDMIDPVRPLNQVHIDFTGGGNGDMPTFQFRNRGSIGKECRITRHALQQMSQYMGIKTSTGRTATPFNLTEARCLIDEDMRRLETIAWSKMLDKNDHEVMFRSKVIDGVRTITSIQGVNYAPLRDSQLLRKIMTEGGNVTQFYIGSDYSQYSIVEGEPKLKDLTKMINILNSDGGMSGLEATLSYFMLICTNGLKSWKQTSSFYNRHFGDKDVIAQMFSDSINEMKKEDDQFIQLYNKGREIELDHLWGTFLYRSRGQFSQDEQDKLQMSLSASNLIASPKNTIGHLIDGITLSAQAKSDPQSRMLIEQKASDMLVDMMNDWEKGKELVPASFLEKLA